MVAHVEVQVETDVPARMRDGTVLRADVYRPSGRGPFPVLLTRTPYGKSALPLNVESSRALASQGYIVVVQDVRGASPPTATSAPSSRSSPTASIPSSGPGASPAPTARSGCGASPTSA